MTPLYVLILYPVLTRYPKDAPPGNSLLPPLALETGPSQRLPALAAGTMGRITCDG